MKQLETGEESLTIQQMAQVTGLSAHTLRYYERAGLMQQRVERDHSSGYRAYTRRDVNWIRFIKRLRATGMPIRDVQHYTELLRQGDETTSARMELLRKHRQRVEQHLSEVEQHLSAINYKIALYEQKYTRQQEAAESF
ncbi:MAG TPA: MerR family transcriptional regulator [Ktedonobacteraceae bacterium]